MMSVESFSISLEGFIFGALVTCGAMIVIAVTMFWAFKTAEPELPLSHIDVDDQDDVPGSDSDGDIKSVGPCRQELLDKYYRDCG
jgi:hypothetical protein